MPGLKFGDIKEAVRASASGETSSDVLGKDCHPIAIIKGDDRRFHNKLLFLDSRDHPVGTKTSITLPDDCQFHYLPTTHEDKRFIGYLAGASGSGKSWMARQIANNYRKMFPDRPVYLLSKLEEDETIDGMEGGKPIRLDYKRWVEEGPPDINTLTNSLVIADDYDTIDGVEGKIIENWLNDIAIMGRKHTDNQGNVSLLCLTHYLTNFKRTRLLLCESSFYVVYPTATSAHALRYLLKNYMGLEDDVIRRLRKMGRYVVCHKQYPQYLMSSHECTLLHHDDEEEPTKNYRVPEHTRVKRG